MEKSSRDIEKDYPLPQFIDKLRRLADALESGSRFEIQIAGERVSVPARATCNIEHERSADGEEEIEFQIKVGRIERNSNSPAIGVRHPRASGDLARIAGDSRLRGNDAQRRPMRPDRRLL